MNPRELLCRLGELLGGSEGAQLKAKVILETVLRAPARDFEGEISDFDVEVALALADRVREGYPVQYVAGSWPFMDFEVQVGEGVLIPRDDTAALVEAAIELVPECDSALDLCAGTGIVGIALSRHYDIPVTQVEKYDAAYEYLKINISLLAPQNRPVQADVITYQNEIADGEYSLIVCNPPYLTKEEYDNAQPELHFEPEQALVGGLDFYRHIIKEYFRCLKPGGYMAFEVGHEQAEAVLQMFTENGYEAAQTRRDLGGIERAVIAKRPLL